MRTQKQCFAWALILCLCIVFACNDSSLDELKSMPDDKLNLSDVRNEVATQTIDEVSKVLREWGKELLIAAKDPETKSLIYEQVEKQFDGDDNVLISTMMEVSEQRNNIPLMTAKNKLSAMNSRQSMQAIGIDGFAMTDSATSERFYPQLYIPSFDKVRSLKSDPVLVIGLGEKDAYPGYILDEQGNLKKHESIIDEKFSKENEVWAITINERVDQNGQIEAEKNVGRQSQTTSSINAHMEDFKLAELKESYVGGKPDVYIMRFSLFDIRPGQSGDRTIYWVGNTHKGNRINTFRRGDLSRVIRVNYTYYWNWRPILGNSTGAKGDVMMYVIYERDGFPARERTAYISIEGASCFTNPQTFYCLGPKRTETIIYRSSDGYYDAGTIYYPYGIPHVYTPRNACDFDARDYNVRSWWTSTCL